MIRKLAAIASAVILGLTLAAKPAEASWNACPVNSFCTWSNTSYWGVFEYFEWVNYGSQCLATRWDVSSIRNRSNHVTLLYTTTNCTGSSFQVVANQSFSPMPSFIGDNNLRSAKMLP